jgi:signal transduction histidine kinase
LRSITLKLVLAFLAVSLVSTLLFGLLARYTTVREFQDYASSNEQSHVAAALEEYYRIEGSWLGIGSAYFYWRAPRTPGGQSIGPREVDPMTVADAHGVVVRAGPDYRIGEVLSSDEIAHSHPLVVDGNTVGYLATGTAAFGRDPLEEAFLERFGQLLVYSALGAVAVSLLLGIILSGTFSRPIRELTTATRAIADGDLSQQVPVRSRDELGQLADSFNRMTTKLARSLHLRRQMTADIAHELRTPLSLILGHAEAVHDGCCRPQPRISRSSAMRRAAWRIWSRTCARSPWPTLGNCPSPRSRWPPKVCCARWRPCTSTARSRRGLLSNSAWSLACPPSRWTPGA